MKNRYDILEEWEEELKSFSVGVRVLIIVSVSFIILILGWEFWISDIIEDINRYEYKNQKIQKKIYHITPKVLEKSISILKHKKMRIEDEIKEHKMKLKKLKAKSYKYSFLWFNEERFLKILKDILKYSLKLGIRVDKVKSLPIKNRDIGAYVKIGKIIEINGVGSYSDIIKLIYYIDSFKIPIDMSSITIWLDRDEIKFKIILTQYGIVL